MGTNYDEYKGYVESFVNKAEEIKNENETTYKVASTPKVEEVKVNENEEVAVTTETKNNYFSTNMDTTFSAFPFFNMIPNSINIFKNLF